MHHTINFWAPVGRDGWAARVVTEDKSVWISAEGVLDAPAASGMAQTVLIRPCEPAGRMIGVAIVPPTARDLVSLNGRLLLEGRHPLHHGDQLEMAGVQYCVTTRLCPEEVEYDPAIHSQQGECCITGTQLEPGEAAVACPGVISIRCGRLAKKSAWESAMAARGTICRACGFYAGLAEWRPPDRGIIRPSGRLEYLVAAVRSRWHFPH